MQARMLDISALMGRNSSRSEMVTKKHHVSLNLKDGKTRDLGEMTDTEALYVQGYSALDKEVTSMTVITTFTHPEEPRERVAIPNADAIVAAENGHIDVA